MSKKIKIILFVIITFFLLKTVNAWVDFNSIDWVNNIIDHSLSSLDNWWDIVNNIENVWFNILTIVKYIISWVLVILLVYTWIQMIISMWSDEEKLTTSKRYLRYVIVALLFINIPWTLYDIFVIDNKWQVDWWLNNWSSSIFTNNIFVDFTNFETTFNWRIILFIETIIFGIAIFMITLAWIKIISSRWQEERITEAKSKILWSLIWLVFIWFIEAWKWFIYEWEISDWAEIFNTMENLALFFAWPVAIFFLILAWWYYITANWNEEKVKKAKNIIIYTIIATIILLVSHAFLKDLITLSI